MTAEAVLFIAGSLLALGFGAVILCLAVYWAGSILYALRATKIRQGLRAILGMGPNPKDHWGIKDEIEQRIYEAMTPEESRNFDNQRAVAEIVKRVLVNIVRDSKERR